MKKILAVVFIPIVLTACVSLSPNVQLSHDGAPQGELLVFREKAFLASGVGLYFGESDKYYFVLDNGGYSRVKIDAGEHVFQAKAHASPAFELRVNVQEGKLTCLKGKVNSIGWGVIMFPIIGNLVNTFVLEQVECPTQESLVVLKK